MMRRCYEASRGRYLMLLNDDMVFATPGWDRAVAEAFRRLPDDIGLVYGDDRDQGKRVPSFPIVSRAACEAMGQLCPVGYLNLHLESHLQDVFRELESLGHKRIVYLAEVVFEHRHVSLGKSLPDATSVKKDPDFDNRLFLSLAEERKELAARLARHIRGLQGDAPPSGPAQAPAVSVILPVSRDSVSLLPRTLPPLFHQEGYASRLEVLVVPDAAAARASSLDALRDLASVRVLADPAVRSASDAANAGARNARADVLLVLQPGCLLGRSALAAMHGVLAGRPEVAVVGCKLVDARNGRIRHAGYGFLMTVKDFAISSLYRGLPAEHPAANRDRELQAVGAAALLVRRDALLEAGGFDPALGSLSTIDLCLKIRESGRKVVYAPGAEVRISEGGGWTDDVHRLRDASGIDALRGRVRSDLAEILQADGVSLPEGLAAHFPLTLLQVGVASQVGA
jgi:hypothetical protein